MQREADDLANLWHKSDASDRKRVARDWYKMCQRLSDIIRLQRVVEEKKKNGRKKLQKRPFGGL